MELFRGGLEVADDGCRRRVVAEEERQQFVEYELARRKAGVVFSQTAEEDVVGDSGET